MKSAEQSIELVDVLGVAETKHPTRFNDCSDGCRPRSCQDCRIESVDKMLTRRPYFADAFNHIRESLTEDSVAVDLGCGTEMTDLRIIQFCGCSLCIGIDMLERPAESPCDTNLVYVRCDVDESSLPLVSESCDVVILNNILEHLHDPLCTLTESVRILREGGLLVIITPNQADLKNRVLLLAGQSIHFPLRRWLLMGNDRVRRGSRSVFVGHVREYTARELHEMVDLVGCVQTHFRYVATAKTPRRNSETGQTGVFDRMDNVARNNRVLFGIYSALEKAIPSLRAQLCVVARKL